MLRALIHTDLTVPLLRLPALKFYLQGASLWGHVMGSEKRPTSSSVEIRNWKLADDRAMTTDLSDTTATLDSANLKVSTKFD
jgi:hypothetical protein